VTEAHWSKDPKRAFAEHSVAAAPPQVITLFWDPTGPKISLDQEGRFICESLNPEKSVMWMMTRGDMWRLGWACIRVALFRYRRSA
jgi:hypothetical protein